jgi:hypothetical protein
VNFHDVIIELRAILKGRQNPKYDINHDGTVDVDDLLLVIDHLGEKCKKHGRGR